MTIFTEFQLTGDLQNQAPMEKYMRHQFSFAGVRTPERKQQAARLIRQSKQVPLPELLAGN
jgi:3-methyladenine DNA glycosylase AlkD